MSLKDRLQHAWNAFTANKDPTHFNRGYTYSSRPDRPRFSRGNERSLVTSVLNRMSLDVASNELQHIKTDSETGYVSHMNSSLNYCLKEEANIDQTGRALIQDIAMSMFDEGCVAVVPVDTTIDPKTSASFEINSLRTAKIIEWMPRHVRVRLYDDRLGKFSEIIQPKDNVAIIENPFYSVMNEPNSTLQRLMRKLALLDVIDEQAGSGKLDLIIQLPYVIKSQARREQAEQRRKDIEMQLSGSKYGIAYTDGTEHITQLNRSLDNQLVKQIEYLTDLLYSQLGITIEILNGTADDKTMLNYYTRTIEPIVSAIAEEMKRKFLSKTARTQGQSIRFFRNPFKLVPVNEIADIADKFTRNEILSTNEVRQLVGFKPIEDQKADELRNKNINASDGQEFATTNGDRVMECPPVEEETETIQKPNGSKELLNKIINKKM